MLFWLETPELYDTIRQSIRRSSDAIAHFIQKKVHHSLRFAGGSWGLYRFPTKVEGISELVPSVWSGEGSDNNSCNDDPY